MALLYILGFLIYFFGSTISVYIGITFVLYNHANNPFTIGLRWDVLGIIMSVTAIIGLLGTFLILFLHPTF